MHPYYFVSVWELQSIFVRHIILCCLSFYSHSLPRSNISAVSKLSGLIDKIRAAINFSTRPLQTVTIRWFNTTNCPWPQHNIVRNRRLLQQCLFSCQNDPQMLFSKHNQPIAPSRGLLDFFANRKTDCSIGFYTHSWWFQINQAVWAFITYDFLNVHRKRGPELYRNLIIP